MDIKTIFAPSVGVELVFDINSLTPKSRSSIIYDVDHARRIITIAQPLVPISKHHGSKEMHLTTIIRSRQEKQRWGVPCTLVGFDNTYQLADHTTTQAVILKYTPNLVEANIRSAYRLPIGRKNTVKAKLSIQDRVYSSGVNFSIKDISLTGLSIIIPRKKDGKSNHLIARIQPGQKGEMELFLVRTGIDRPESIQVTIEIIRIHPTLSKTAMLAGGKFLKLNKEMEERLSRFIHQSQLDELKRRSRMG